MHNLGQRHQLLAGIGPVLKGGNGALLDAGRYLGIASHHRNQKGPVVADVVESGHVDASHGGQLAQHLLAGAGGHPRPFPGPDHLGDLRNHLFAVTQHEGVHEIGQRLGVVRAVTPRDDQRVLFSSIRHPNGHPGEIDAVQHVGVGELGGQVEGQHVELVAGQMVLQREQRHLMAAHLRFEIKPRRVRALGHRVVSLVDDLVEDLQALVGQADLVGIGVDQQPGHFVGAVKGTLGAVLAPDVAGRFLHPGEQGFKPGPDGRHVELHTTAQAATPRVGGRRQSARPEGKDPAERGWTASGDGRG